MQKSNLDINRKLLEHAIIIFAEGKLLNYSFKKDKYNIQILDAKKNNIENLSTLNFIIISLKNLSILRING